MRLKQKKYHKFENVFGVIFLVFVVVAMFVPLWMMITMSFKNGNNEILSNFWKPPTHLYFGNYIKAWEQIKNSYVNSIWISFWAVLGIVFISLITGFAFSKYKFKFKDTLYSLLVATMAIPAGLLLVPNFLNIKSLGLYNTRFAVIITAIATSSVMGTILTRTYIDKIPDSILESLRMDGASEIKIFTSFIIPISAPVMATVGIMNLISTFNNFMWPYVVLADESLYTVPIALAKIGGSQNVDYGVQMAGYALAALPLIIIFSFAMKWYIAGVTTGAVKE